MKRWQIERLARPAAAPAKRSLRIPKWTYAVTAAAAGLVFATGYRILISLKTKRMLAYLLAFITAVPVMLGVSLPLVVAIVCIGGFLAERISERAT